MQHEAQLREIREEEEIEKAIKEKREMLRNLKPHCNRMMNYLPLHSIKIV